MPQPVKLSDRLLSVARKVAPLANRSIAGQIEHWAVLGRMVEKNLTSSQVLALKQGRKMKVPGPNADPAAAAQDPVHR